MYVYFAIAYAIISIVQLFAIVAFFEIHFNNWGIFDVAFAFTTTWVPIIGSILGVLGAMEGWDWSIWQAGLLFFWYIPAVIVFWAFRLLFNR